MKKLVTIAVIFILTSIVAHGDHDEVKTIIPIMHEGWNLLGFSLEPYVVNDSIVSSGYNAIMYAALDDRVWYFYSTGYAVADSFVIGEGFWLKSFVDAPLIQQGKASERRIHILYEGWNIVSPLEDEIHPLLLVYSHQTIDSIWGWDYYNYQYTDMLATQEHLVPGYGYWIHATHEDTLFYDGFSNQTPPQAPAKMVAPLSQETPPSPPIKRPFLKNKYQTWGELKNDIHNSATLH